MSAPGPNALLELLGRLVVDPAVPRARVVAFNLYLGGDRSLALSQSAHELWRSWGSGDVGVLAASGWACGAIHADLSGAPHSRDGYTRFALDELEDAEKTQEMVAVWWETDAAGQPGGRS